MKEEVEGVWRNITGLVVQNRHKDRSILRLKCGHTAVVHRYVPQHNGLMFDFGQKAVFCTICRLEKVG